MLLHKQLALKLTQAQGDHAIFSASKAEQWMNCPASLQVTMNGKKSTSSFFAEEGTAAHELGEKCLVNNLPTSAAAGTIIYKDFIVDDDMVINVQKYVDYVNALTNEGDTVLVESKLDYTEYVPGGFGTADAIVIQKDALHVIDLKYGKGEKVDAANNKQMQLYAIGALEITAMLGITIKRVFMHIVQPRIGHYDEWSRTPKQLHMFGKKATRASTAALKPDPKFGPSEKGCRWCGFADKCKPLANHNVALISEDFDSLDEVLENDNTALIDGNTISLNELSKLIPHLNNIGKWIKALEARGFDELMSGHDVLDHKLVEGRSIRKWSDEETAEKVLFATIGDRAYSKKVISPTQAEKICVKGTMDTWIVKPPGKPTMVHISDKRKPFEVKAVSDEFNCLQDD
jgi:hypothetical protein